MLPYGVPFDSLSFLYLPSGHFFDFKNLLVLSRFLTLQFFITRRWPSLVVTKGSHFDLFQNYITLAIFFLISKTHWVYRLFWTPKFFNVTDGRMDGVGWMGWMGWMEWMGWSGIEHKFEISRKKLDIFFWLILVPSEDFLRHLLRKN